MVLLQSISFFPGKCHYNGTHLQTKMSKRSEQIKITSLFGPGPSNSPKHSENTSTDITDESSEVAECSAITVFVHINCFMNDHNDIKFKISRKNPEYSRRTLLDFVCIQTLKSL
jgi:hypothetical protein